MRGFSGRFSGKEQSNSPQKSPQPSSSGAPLAIQNPDAGGGSSNQASGTELFPSELTAHYTSMAGLTGNVVQSIPDMCTGSSLTAAGGQAVSLALNQLGRSTIIEQSSPAITTVSSGGDSNQLQQALGDATIQGLINSTHRFTVPVLPSLSSNETADSTMSLITNPQISVQSNQVDISAISASLDETLPINARSTAAPTNVCEPLGSTHCNEQLAAASSTRSPDNMLSEKQC